MNKLSIETKLFIILFKLHVENYDSMSAMWFMNKAVHCLKACIHVPSPSLFPCLSNFNIVPMETDRLMDRMGTVLILPVKFRVVKNPLRIHTSKANTH